MMNPFWQDIRFAFRMMAKSKGVTTLAIVALAIGIGANSSIFTMVNTVMFSSLPFPDSERLLRVYEKHEERGSQRDSISGPDFLDVQRQCRSFENITLISNKHFNLTGGGQPQRVSAYLFTPSQFDIIKIKMAIGRPYIKGEDREGNNRVAVLSYGLWKDRYGASANVLKEPILLDDVPYTVVGVLPASLGFLEGEAQLWLPLTEEAINQERGKRQFASMALLKTDATLEQARAEMDVISTQLAKAYPDTNKNIRLVTEPMMDQLARLVGTTFIVLHAAVGFVLLIACSIVASLLLARSGVRRKEIAIRSALGASRGRVIRQLLTESLLLSLAGGALGLLFSIWGIEFIASLMPPAISSILVVRGIDTYVLIFALTLSLLTGLIFGIAPALQTMKVNLSETLKEGGRSSSGRSGSHKMLKTLVVSEIALALILMIGAGLMVNSYIHLQHANPGFQSENILTFHVSLPETKYPDDQRKRVFYRDAVQRLANLPGVQSVGAPNILPMNYSSSVAFEIQGQDAPPDEDDFTALLRHVNSDYFKAVGIPLLQGRPFDSSDENEDVFRIIINEVFTRRFMPNQNPIGQLVRFPDWDGKAYQIVGVAGNVKHFGLRSGDQPAIYVSYMHRPSPGIGFAVHTTQPPANLSQAARETIWAIDPNLPIEQLQTMEAAIEDRMFMEKMGMVLMSLLSAVALILTSIGIYGIMAYSVSQRTQEIGIRMALGAKLIDVIRLIVGQGIQLTLAGVIIGLSVSFMMMRLLSSLLYEKTSTTDPITFFGVSLFFIVVAAFACYIPARKAAKVDPMITLRHE